MICGFLIAKSLLNILTQNYVTPKRHFIRNEYGDQKKDLISRKGGDLGQFEAALFT